MESKNLILLTEDESKIAIDIGLRGELKVYIIDAAKNLQLTAKAKKAIYNYSVWKTNNTARKNMMSLVVEPLLKKITLDVRELEFLKRILKSEFKEL